MSAGPSEVELTGVHATVRAPLATGTFTNIDRKAQLGRPAPALLGSARLELHPAVDGAA